MTPTSPPTIAMEDLLKSCIHCGYCLPACPTYQATGSEAESPRGRLYLMNAWSQDDTLSGEDIKPHLDQCLGCLACETACPSGVEYGNILHQSRVELNQSHGGLGRRFKRFVFKSILPNHPLLVFFGSLLALYQRSGLQALVRKSNILKPLGPLAHQEALMPSVPQRKAFDDNFTAGPANGVPVNLFVGCVMDIFYNPVHWDTVKALVHNGYRVTAIEGQTCCGALAHHSGETDIAQALAKKNIDALLVNNPDWIVINSAGCGSTLKDYGHLLGDDPDYAEKAKTLSKKAIDVMALLAKRTLEEPSFDQKIDRVTVSYHPPCHLHHAQGVHDAVQSVLRQLPFIKLVPLTNATECCGSAGIYNLEHPELSNEILATKTTHILNAGADIVATGNPGCLLQIEQGLKNTGAPITVEHPVTLVAHWYRFADNNA